MVSNHAAMDILDEDERAMVLAYHRRLPSHSSTNMPDILQVTGDIHGAAPSTDATSRGLYSTVLHSIASHVPEPQGPGVSSASSACEHVIPSPLSSSFLPHAVESPVKKHKREPFLDIANKPFVSVEESSGEEHIPISFLPQWLQLSKLEKYGEAAELWADTMGAIWCHEVMIVLKFVLLFLLIQVIKYNIIIYSILLFYLKLKVINNIDDFVTNIGMKPFEVKRLCTTFEHVNKLSA